MKKYGIKWYLFVSALSLLCGSCFMSLVFCTVVSQKVMSDSARDIHLDELKQIDNNMEQIYYRGKRRMESIGNDTGIRTIIQEINNSTAYAQIYKCLKQLNTGIRSSLFGANEFTSFYVVTSRSVLAIDELWTDAQAIIRYSSEENIYEALLRDYEQFIPTKSVPQQRIVQPIGKEACLVGILNYQEAWKKSNNIIIEQEDGILLFDNREEEALQNAADILTYQSMVVERRLSKVITSYDLAPDWKKLFEISLFLSILIIGITAWFLYLYCGKISRPILQFGEMISASGGNAKEAQRAYEKKFKGLRSIQSMVFRYYVFSLIPVIFLILLHTFVYQQNLYKVLYERATSKLELLEKNVNDELDEYLYLARFISFNTKIRDELFWLNQSEQEEKRNNALPQLLMSKGVMGKNITNVVFYGEDFSMLYSSAENTRDAEVLAVDLDGYFKPKNVQTWWNLQDKRENVYTMIWRVRYLPDRKSETRSFQPIGYIRFDIRDLFRHTSDAVSSKQPLYYDIIDKDGSYLVNNAQGSGLEMVVSKVLQNTPWTLRLFMDRKQILWESITSFRFHLWILCGSIGFVLIMCLILTRQIRKPVLFLKNGILHDDMESLTAVYKISNINEFAMLANNFEEMLTRMDAMNQELIQNRIKQIEIEKRKKEAELTAMQMQISPHFIYNIFSSIQFLLVAENLEQASRMIKGVGEFMRAGIYRSSQNVTLETELNHAEAYINLQSLRYGSKLIFSFEMEQALRKIPVPRFIIQPLLENSIEHGFAKKRPLKIDISIVGKEEGRIEITVTDNGIGILEDVKRELEQTVRQCRQNEHIGLVNVYERLQLYFGQESTFTIESIPDCKTVVTLTFKRRLEEV